MDGDFQPPPGFNDDGGCGVSGGVWNAITGECITCGEEEYFSFLSLSCELCPEGLTPANDVFFGLGEPCQESDMTAGIFNTTEGTFMPVKCDDGFIWDPVLGKCEPDCLMAGLDPNCKDGFTTNVADGVGMTTFSFTTTGPAPSGNVLFYSMVGVGAGIAVGIVALLLLVAICVVKYGRKSKSGQNALQASESGHNGCDNTYKDGEIVQSITIAKPNQMASVTNSVVDEKAGITTLGSLDTRLGNVNASTTLGILDNVDGSTTLGSLDTGLGNVNASTTLGILDNLDGSTTPGIVGNVDGSTTLKGRLDNSDGSTTLQGRLDNSDGSTTLQGRLDNSDGSTTPGIVGNSDGSTTLGSLDTRLDDVNGSTTLGSLDNAAGTTTPGILGNADGSTTLRSLDNAAGSTPQGI